MPTRLREATTDDIPAIQEVGRTVWHAAYKDLLKEETITAAVEAWYDDEALRESLTDETAATYVVDAGSDILGYGTITWEGHEAELKSLYIHPDHQSQGLGTALLAKLIETMPFRIHELTLRVLTGNKGAKRFYERHGFEREQTEEDDLFGETVSIDIYAKRFNA